MNEKKCEFDELFMPNTKCGLCKLNHYEVKVCSVHMQTKWCVCVINKKVGI